MTLRGGPDYGVWAPKHTVTALADLAELAARLQSPYIFDRRGDVVIMDDFEDPPLKWTISHSGVGSLVERSSVTAFAGGWSARLRTGDAAGNDAIISKRVFEPESRKCGLTAFFCTPSHFTTAELGMRLPAEDVLHQGIIRLRAAAGTIEYLSAEGTWIAFAPLPDLPRAFHAFWPVKLILDFEKTTYHEFLLGPYSYDIKHITLRRLGGWVIPFSHIHIRAITDTVGNRDMYVDNVVFTRNEP